MTDPLSDAVDKHDAVVPARPSRAEIETLCILHAVGRDGCSTRDLAARLGLSSDLVPWMAATIEPLVAAEWLEMHGDAVRATEAGLTRLRERLAEFRVA